MPLGDLIRIINYQTPGQSKPGIAWRGDGCFISDDTFDTVRLVDLATAKDASGFTFGTASGGIGPKGPGGRLLFSLGSGGAGGVGLIELPQANQAGTTFPGATRTAFAGAYMPGWNGFSIVGYAYGVVRVEYFNATFQSQNSTTWISTHSFQVSGAASCHVYRGLPFDGMHYYSVTNSKGGTSPYSGALTGISVLNKHANDGQFTIVRTASTPINERVDGLAIDGNRLYISYGNVNQIYAVALS